MAIGAIGGATLAGLIATAGRWFAVYLIGSAIARIAGLVIIYSFTDTFVDSLIDLVFGKLQQFSGIQVLQLAGVGDAVSILGSALALLVAIKGVGWSFNLGAVS